jgi:UDP-N-acetylmuramate--alanine ligase
MGELNSIRAHGLICYKRAEVLGFITRETKSLAVAGTHGKTTTSAMLANILDKSKLGCNAFLGGIASNFNSNYLGNKNTEYTVVEADEFDRSFLNLYPSASIVTSTDSDHLDIYEDGNNLLDGFQKYADQIQDGGVLIHESSVQLHHQNSISYGLSADADYSAENLRIEEGRFMFDASLPDEKWDDIELGIPGIHNVENAVACIALCSWMGIGKEVILSGLKDFAGVHRRFDYHVRKKNLIYIDDYAHHPTEIRAIISSVKLMFPETKLTVIFQPHLYSRTKDFMSDFARELSKVDELLLMPIYPARELPMQGITSEALLGFVSLADKKLAKNEEVLKMMSNRKSGVILTLGAGDIDKLVEPLKNMLLNS